MDRVEIACGLLGLSHKQLAAAVGVSTTTLAAWANGIPSDRLEKLAQVLSVSKEWISTGINPPHRYVVMVMTSGRGCIDWASLPSTVALAAWWEIIECALFDRLRKSPCSLTIPLHVRVPRWRFTLTRYMINPDPRPMDISLFDQLDPRQLESMACELGAWPRETNVAAIIRSGLSQGLYRLTGDSSDDPGRWQRLLRQLSDCARRYRAARVDRQRQDECRLVVWKLLTEQQTDEPLLAGRAIIPVLGACIRTAQTTEIMFAKRSDLRRAVHIALISDFRGRDFTINEMCRYLERHRGLHSSVTDGGNQRAVPGGTISTDTVMRLLRKISTAGELPLTLSCSDRAQTAAGRTWHMGIPILDLNDVHVPIE